MATTAGEPGTVKTHYAVDWDGLVRLIASLHTSGYEVIAPQIRDGAVILDTLEKADDLPVGWRDEQAPGRYRISRNGVPTVFGYAVGPHTWKRFLHPPDVRLFRAERSAQDFRIVDSPEEPPKRAFLGVRACDLAAIGIQDRILSQDRYSEPGYASRRRNLLVIAVQCTQPSANCFCASMETGPAVKEGFDLALTEVMDGETSALLLEVGSETGASLIAGLKLHKAPAKLVRQAEASVRDTASRLTRHMDTGGIRDLLYQSFEHPRWDETAARCLNCGNCTLSCPTCFCSTVEDTSDVTGRNAERWRRWDSCFVQSFSYIHGGSVRMSSRSRYRQWLTHKLAAWIDQFGTSGCVGCGRCITWCPVGIDITEEIAAIRGANVAAAGGESR
jgi:ferredoxin